MKIKHHSPSSLNKFCGDLAAYTYDYILSPALNLPRQPVGCKAHRGTAVEEGVTTGLLYGGNLKECLSAALTRYDTVSALSHDAKREIFRDSIGDMLQHALIELRPYGKPSKYQGFVEWRPEALKYPIIGYFDYEWADHGIIVDLKTTEKLPSAISPEHARQVALYCPSDNTDARLTYVTPKKSATYRLENIREHRQALYQIALRVERFLSLSDEPEFFTKITAPDVSSFYWGGPARQLAFEHWGI